MEKYFEKFLYYFSEGQNVSLCASIMKSTIELLQKKCKWQ